MGPGRRSLAANLPGRSAGVVASQATSSQQYHSGWSIFAAEDPGHTGSTSSQGEQHAAGSNPGATGFQPNHQQQQLQQPRHPPREAVNRGTAPAATNQWNSGWSPAHHNHRQAHHSQPQYPQSTAQGRGTWGYAATAAPSNGPWRPRYAPVYDPYTDPWHEDEEDDPLPTQTQSYPQELGRPLIQGGGAGAQQQQWGQAQAQYPSGQTVTMARGASARRGLPDTSPGTTPSTKRSDPHPSNSADVAAAASAHPGVSHLPGQSTQRNTGAASQSRGSKPTPTATPTARRHKQPAGGNRTIPQHTRRAGGATSPATAAAAAETHPGRAGEDQSAQTYESTRAS